MILCHVIRSHFGASLLACLGLCFWRTILGSCMSREALLSDDGCSDEDEPVRKRSRRHENVKSTRRVLLVSDSSGYEPKGFQSFMMPRVSGFGRIDGKRILGIVVLGWQLFSGDAEPTVPAEASHLVNAGRRWRGSAVVLNNAMYVDYWITDAFWLQAPAEYAIGTIWQAPFPSRQCWKLYVFRVCSIEFVCVELFRVWVPFLLEQKRKHLNTKKTNRTNSRHNNKNIDEHKL